MDIMNIANSQNLVIYNTLLEATVWTQGIAKKYVPDLHKKINVNK